MSLEEVQAVNLTQSVLGTTESNALATDVVLLQDGAVGGQLGRNSSEPCPEFFLSLLTLSSHMDGSLPCTVGSLTYGEVSAACNFTITLLGQG